MAPPEQPTIWTIGHSTRTRDEFEALLLTFQICMLADIRRFPGSRRFPHFNKEALSSNLPLVGIQYTHFAELGGRRKAREDSLNTGWRNPSFKGYADYMETGGFQIAVSNLERLALAKSTALMCSEAVWWRCHRALLADYLKVKGWRVIHIGGINQATGHPYTAPARIVQGKLFYDAKVE